MKGGILSWIYNFSLDAGLIQLCFFSSDAETGALLG
jgi:hypothetical protein